MVENIAISPEEALAREIASIDEQLQHAINTLLAAWYKRKPLNIHQEHVEDLIGAKRWNVGEHPRRLREVLKHYMAVGWRVVESSANPHYPRWTFTAIKD